MPFTRLMILGLMICSSPAAIAQIKIGDNPTTINANSVLELESTDKGFVPARVALTATNATTPLSGTLYTGTLVYNTATAGSGSTAVVPGYYYWNGTRWVTFAFSDASAIQSILEPVLDNTRNNPTGLTPNDGDAYLVAAGATGTWAGNSNKIAKWNASGGSWVFYTPLTNDQTTVTAGTNAGSVYKYNGTSWVLQASGASADWQLGGNTNTTATNNILGVLNNNPLRFYTNGTQKMTILANGHVGIGTASPDYQLEVSGTPTTIPSSARIAAVQSNGAQWLANPGAASGGVKIFTDGWYGGTGGIALHSDARIKKIIGISDSRKDLALLSAIQITDYTKIDFVADNRHYKKVIAQQVEPIFPQAILTSTDYIPNVYEVAAAATANSKGNTTITTKKAHDFKTGDMVRFETSDKGVCYLPVTVSNAHTFTVDHSFSTNQVFVYGKQVTDFKSVDYEAIAMLNVSATQELERQIRELKAENAALKGQVNELSTLKADVDALKAMLQPADPARGANKLTAKSDLAGRP